MKKVAFICGLLFVVVFVWVNLFESDEDPLETNYHVSAAGSLSPAIGADATVYPVSYESGVKDVAGPAYYLIVASYNDITQARQAADRYTSDYGDDFIILPPTLEGNYRISFGRYSSLDAVDAALPGVRQTINHDAWVYSEGN